jgi:hypothetical protein
MSELAVPLIVLATDDPEAVDRVGPALDAAGWEVETVGSRDEGLSFRPGRVPDLVVVEEGVPGAEDLVRTFSRCRGGPGVVLLCQGPAATEPPPRLKDADVFLGSSSTAQELIEAVRSRLSLEPAGRAGDGFDDEERVYTTEEIFGDILSELSDLGEEPELEGLGSGNRESLSQESSEDLEESFAGDEREPPPQPIAWVGAAPEAPRENEVEEEAIDLAESVKEPLSGEALVRSLAEARQVPEEKPKPPEEPPPPAAREPGLEKVLPVFYQAQGSSEEPPTGADVGKEVDWMLAAVVEESKAGVASLGFASVVDRDETAALDSLQRLVGDDVAPSNGERGQPAVVKAQSPAELLSLPDSEAARSREELSPSLSGTMAAVVEEGGSQGSDQPVRVNRSRWAAMWRKFADPLDLVGKHRASEVGGDAPHFLGGDSIDE